MVCHKAIGVTYPVVAFVDVLESVQKVLAVLIGLKDGFLLVAARGYMVNSTWIFYAEGAGHGSTVTQYKAIFKEKDLTLKILLCIGFEARIEWNIN
jgi:hypothetical protein